MNNTLIIHGGGSSIKNLIPLGLWAALEGLFVFGINFSFKDHIPTALISCDYKFYRGLIDLPDNTYNPLFHAALEKVPLIIVPNREDLIPYIMKNTKIAPYVPQFCENSGLYATYLASFLPISEIYLLGLDFCDIDHSTHYYKHTKHRGIGRVSINYFKRANPDALFSMIDFKDIKVYNVSPQSKITIFPKITPEEFIKKAKRLPKLNQETLRNQIKINLLTLQSHTN